MSVQVTRAARGARLDATAPSDGTIASERPSLLPAPGFAGGDAAIALCAMLAESRDQRTRDALGRIAMTSDLRKQAIERQREAIAKAFEAAEDRGGLFDSLGVGSVAGIALASPWLVIADMGMHMAKLTPDELAEFEKEALPKIQEAATAYGALQGATAALRAGLRGPEGVALLVVAAGMAAKESGLLGAEVSDWAGRAGAIGGGAALGDVRSGVVAFVAEKEGPAADRIRDVEQKTKPYWKWASYAAMGAAAVGACVGTCGTGTPFVAAIVGLALSASGAVVTETKCLGEDWSKYVGLGLMAAGALMSAGGVAHAAQLGVSTSANVAGRHLVAVGGVVGGATNVKGGAAQVHQAAVDHAVLQARNTGLSADLERKKHDAVLDRLTEIVGDAMRGFERAATIAREILEQDHETSLAAAGAIRA